MNKELVFSWIQVLQNHYSNGLLYVRFNTKLTKLSVIVWYAPINNEEDEDKDKFYDSLQLTLEDIPKHDHTILVGDFIARVATTKEEKK